MKRILLAGVLGAAVALPALAQTTTVTTAPGVGTTVTVTPERRTAIKRYVTERRVRPITMGERLAVGATLPADIELEAVPDDWGPDFGRYQYVYSNDHVILVEPSTRRVIQVID